MIDRITEAFYLFFIVIIGEVSELSNVWADSSIDEVGGVSPILLGESRQL